MITGGAAGVGPALVGRFLANGAIVIATEINDEALEKLPGMRNADAKVIIALGDISKEEDLRSARPSRAKRRRVSTPWSTVPGIPAPPQGDVARRVESGHRH